MGLPPVALSVTFPLGLRSHSPGQESSTTDFNQLLESLTVTQHTPTPWFCKVMAGPVVGNYHSSPKIIQTYTNAIWALSILRDLAFLGRGEKCFFPQLSNSCVLTEELSYPSSHYYWILLWPTIQSNWNGWKTMLYLYGERKKPDKFWYTLKGSSRKATDKLYQ